jgi:hypothetical protein
VKGILGQADLIPDDGGGPILKIVFAQNGLVAVGIFTADFIRRVGQQLL